MRTLLFVGALAFLAGLLPTVLVGQEPLVTAKRGLVGELEFRYEGRALEARPQRDLRADMLLRLEANPDERGAYTARFLGSVEGDFDLRELIQPVGGFGETVTLSGLQPLRVTVVSSLEDRLSTDLFPAADLNVSFYGRYVLTMWVLAVAWLMVPVVVLVVRYARRKPEQEVAEIPPPPTVEELLRPICDAAAERPLTVEERARLELLLYRHWRERLGLRERDLAGSIQELRRQATSSELFLDIERWLHSPTGGDPVDPARLRPKVKEASAS